MDLSLYAVSYREDRPEGQSEFLVERVRAVSPEDAERQVEREDRIIERVRVVSFA